MTFSEYLGYVKGTTPRIRDRNAVQTLISALRHYNKTHEQYALLRRTPSAMLRDATLITKRKYDDNDFAVAANDLESLL